ncbi:hypothetical protein ACWATR_38785 [Nostoc sp. UIC 10890]
MSKLKLSVSNSINSQNSKHFIELTVFILGNEIKTEIPVSKQQYKAIEQEKQNGEERWNTAESIVDDYLNENFEIDYTLNRRIEL